MRGIGWDDSRTPEFHDDLLIVRVHRGAAAAHTQGTMGRGLTHLARLERDGHIHSMHVLDHRAHSPAATLRHALTRASAHRGREAHTGSVLIRLHHKSHRHRLHQALADDPHIHWAHRVPCRYVGAAKSPELPVQRMWHHPAIRLEEARAKRAFREPRTIRVAVLDTGVDRDHPALRGRITRYEHRIGSAHPSPADIAGHGTHVSGIIAAADREIGVRGMCQPKLSVYKIFGDRSVAIVNAGKSFRIFLVDPVAYYAALGDCLRRGMDVINLSLGGTGASDPHERALVQSLIAAGTVVVAAMGNTTVDRTQVSYPAAIPGVIAVGAVGPSGVIANFSRIGAHITLVAPGESIWSTLPCQPGEFGFAIAKDGAPLPGPNPLQRNVRYDAWPGTSMACPQVTAAVAMLLATRGRMTPAEVQRRLKRSAEPLAAMRGKRFTPTYGAGRLNVERLLARLER